MYAGTIIEYVDLSEIPVLETVEERDPFYITVFSSEKGTEDPIIIGGQDFFKMFVTPDPTQPSGYFIPFAKHGQPLLQAANIINAGAKVYAKRVVAEDATLANIVIYANVNSGKVQEEIGGVTQYYSLDDEGNYVLDINGKKIKVSQAHNDSGIPNEPVMIDRVTIRYTYSWSDTAKSIGQIVANNSSPRSTLYTYNVTSTLTAGSYSFTDEDGVIYEFSLSSDLNEGDTIAWSSGLTSVVVKSGEQTSTIAITEVTSSTETVINFERTKEFPLIVITDNGRGESKKKIRIVPNYEYSKDYDFMLYNFIVNEEGTSLVNKLVSLDPEVKYLSSNVSIKNQFNYQMSQIKTEFIESSYRELIQYIADATGNTFKEVQSIDILNGTDRKGEKLSYIHVFGTTEEEKAQLDYNVDIDLQTVYGNQLVGGSNGAFGSAPIDTPEYADAVAGFFNGEYTDDIYDVDNLKFDFVIDANYPSKVKKAIEDFVMFREDCSFFCDFGLEVTNFHDIENMVQVSRDDARKADSKFVFYYHNYYDIIDPYTNKQITVTICYDIAALLVDHCRNGRIRPFAGQLYNITLPNAIEGTVNYIPKIIPGENQKQKMNDIRVNYASYYDGVLTIDSEYTSQKKHTQFSYINNVLATQEVVKAIRTRCPKIRYSFLGQEGLIAYKEDVQNNVLKYYASNFETLQLVYLGDSTYETNKIFYAGINVRFKDFVQTEIFKVYALL